MEDESEEQYQKARAHVIEWQSASTSFIQRYLQCGYNRAARHLERMVAEGVVTEPNEVGKRTVLEKPLPPPPATGGDV